MDPAPGTQNPNLNILLVEDDLGDARLLQEVLFRIDPQRPLGASYNLEHMDCYEAALDRLAQGGIDVVLLDLSLPGAEALELIDQTRQAAPEIPIVVLTSHDDQCLAIQALQLGAQDYLVKSQTLDFLLERALRYAVERHRLQMAIRSLSLIDDLTGLYNRRGFTTLAEQHLKHASRHGKNLLLVFGDVDNMKLINDRFGHPQGDQALIKVAAVLRTTFRNSDLLARIGGDEFNILVLDELKDSTRIIQSRLQEEFQKFNGAAGLPFYLSLSTGIARFNPQTTTSIEAPMAAADRDLYQQKRLKRAMAAGS
jgi:two-component system cell cycle response regulator